MATLVLAVGVATCADSPTGPARGSQASGRVDLQPSFSVGAQFAAQHAADFGIGFDSVRIVIRRLPDLTFVVKDTALAFGPTSAPLDLDLTVPVQADAESFDATIRYQLAGAIVFSGEAKVQSHPAGAPSIVPTPIPVDYVGPGAGVQRITITPKTATVLSTQTVAFSVSAVDSSGSATALPPLAWTSSNAAIGQVMSGLLQPEGPRGTVIVSAFTPTGKTDSATVMVTLPPWAIALVSGAGQTGAPGGELPNPLVVQVNAADGVGVPGVNVLFAAPAGGSVGTASATTDSVGRASTTLRLGSAAGLQSFAATAGTLSLGASENASAAGPVGIAALSGGGQTDTVGHALHQPLTVHVADQFNNPVSGVRVDWSRNGTGTLSAATSATGADGNAAVSYTLGTIAASETISALIDGTSLSVSFTVTAVAGDAAALTWKTQPTNGVANAIVAPAMQVALVDRFGNVTAASDPVTISLTAGTTGAVADGTLTKNAVGGVATFDNVKVDRGGDGYVFVAAARTLTARSAPFSVTTAAAAAMSIVDGDNQTAVVNSGAATPPSVRLVDASNGPVVGASITFTPGNGSGSVQPAGGIVTTNANGVAALSSWTLGKTAGPQTLVASAVGVPIVTFHAISSPGAPASLQWRVQPSNVMAATPIAPPIQVAILDAFGNVTTSTASVTLALGTSAVLARVSPAAASARPRAQTDGSTPTLGGTVTRAAVGGIATFGDITVDRAGTGFTLVASAPGLSAASESGSFTVSVGPPSTLSIFAGNNQSAIVNTPVATPPAIRLLDGSGNAVAGATITFTPAGGSGSIVPSNGIVQTNAQGIAALTSWTLGTLPGINDDTVAVAAGPGLNATFTATALPGVLHHFAVEAASGGAIGTQTSGVPFSVRITAQDVYNNTVTSFTGTVDVTSNRVGTAGLTTTAPFAAGVLASQMISLTQSGTGATITVTRTAGAETGASNPFTVSPGAVARFDVEAAAGGPIANQTAGVPFTIRITARDASGNVATAFSGVVNVSSSVAGTSGLGTSGAFTAGVLASQVVTLTQAATSATITATRSGGTENGTSAAFAVSAGTVQHFVVEASSGGPIGAETAGAPFTIRITAQDAFNNVATSFTGTVDVSSNRASSLPRSAAFSGGVLASYSVTLTQSGAAGTITVTRTGGTETGTSNAFNVLGGAPAQLVTLAGVDNQTATVATAVPTPPGVTVLDGSGNPVGGVAVTFAVASGSGAVNRTGRLVAAPSRNRRPTARVLADATDPSAGTTTVTTGPDGVARVSAWTLGTVAGLQKLSVMVGSATDTIRATATADHTTQMVFSTHPQDTVIATVALPAQLTVADQFNNPGIDPVTLSLAANPGGDVLAGTLTRTPVAGVVTFDDVSLKNLARGYQLAASSFGLPAVTSNSFDVIGPAGTIFTDLRATLPLASNIDDAFALFGVVDHTDYRAVKGGSGWSFTTNADGHGLHAFRADWAAAPTDGDQGIRVVNYLPTPQTELWVQFKNRVGGYPFDTDANGTSNTYPTFATGTPDGLTACKRALFGDGTSTRIDYVLNRSNPEFPRVEIGAATYLRFGDLTWGFDQEIGKAPYTTTIHIKKASSDAVADGLFELWIDNNLTLRQHDVPSGASGITDWSFPTTCVNMPVAASEYFWDVVVWAP